MRNHIFFLFCIAPVVILDAFKSSSILNNKLLPMWYPLMSMKEAKKKNIHKVHIMDRPMVCYDNRNQSFVLHTDICPHQGASLSKGWINEFGHIQCPYHGFEFCEGMFCKIPNPSLSLQKFKSKTQLPMYPVKQFQDTLFFFPDSRLKVNDTPFFPPEEYDESFRSISGSRIVNKDYMSVCENLLDMLHISYVHSFGSTFTPLPYMIRSMHKDERSGRTEFHYQPRDMTISRQIGKVTTVIVQNEYHLPTNTITRVFAGPVIKTVFTRSLPISSKKTLLFWKVYRNFWIDPYTPEFSLIGDHLLHFLMERTIDEDVRILENVYSEYREGPLKTKYDTTIRNFREAIRNYNKNNTNVIINEEKKHVNPIHLFDL